MMCDYPINARQILRSLFTILIATALLCICFIYVYSDSLSSHFRATFLRPLLMTESPDPPVILLWTTYFEKKDYLPPLDSLGCPVTDCIISSNRSLLNESDAVVFHWRNINMEDIPERSHDQQKWILFNEEAPTNTPRYILEALSGHINWTVTYRHDSDILAPYGMVRPLNTSKPLPVIPKRDRLVCWVVSNCKTPSQRETFVDQLSRFVPVAVYGKCGKLKCLDGQLRCYSTLSKRCKFYLSFENSICKDYVTEKLFLALKTNMVPIVMGGADYSQILPKNSYIDALSFKDPLALASYLLELDMDDEKYMSYHAWNTQYEVIDMAYKWSCDLCKLLHLEHSVLNTDLVSWWFGDAQCRSWYEDINFLDNFI